MYKAWLYGLLACLISVPVLVYLFGSIVVGPYEGEGGLIGMMGSIYVDAITLQPSALVLLVSPLLLILVWKLSLRLRRIMPN